MTKRNRMETAPLLTPRGTILKRIPTFLPDLNEIQKSFGVGQTRAEEIAILLEVVTGLLVKIASHQAVMDTGNLDTAELIRVQVGVAHDAGIIFSPDEIKIRLQNDPETALFLLEIMSSSTFAAAFGKLTERKQQEHFASLRQAVTALQSLSGGMLEEPE